MSYRVQTTFFLVLVSNFSLAISARATDGIECSCAVTGPYVDAVHGVPPAVTVVSANSGTSPHGVYIVTALAMGTVIDLTITRTSNGATLFHDLPPVGASWGFSPDDDRFVLQYNNNPTHVVSVYNLAGSTPDQSIKTYSASTSSSRTLFSASGHYFFYAALTTSPHTLLSIIAATNGVAAFETEFDFSSPPGGTNDQFGLTSWGFSPDGHERTFAYAYVSGQSSVLFSMINLEKKQKVYEVSIFGDSFWQFTRCGNLLGIVRHPFQNQVTISLFRTLNGTLATPEQTFSYGDVFFRTTSSQQIANIGGSDYVIATNSAGLACPPPGPPNVPPVAGFTFPLIVRRAIPATFTDTSQDSDGTIVAWLWNFGDGSTSMLQNPAHTYSSNGALTVTLTVTDDGDGTNTVSHSVTVLPNDPPHASFGFTPSNPSARDIVTFTDTSTDDDGIASRSWSFGSVDAVAQFKACTTFDVSSTVFDHAGQADTITRTIVVTASDPTILVPAGGDIAAAIASACPGNTIRLEAGTYRGGFLLQDVNLEGAGRGLTIITGGPPTTAQWVIVATAARFSSNFIQDLTITGGGNNGCSLPATLECKGGGILLEGRGSWSLLNVEVKENLGAGGIYSRILGGGGTRLEVRHSTIVSNVNQYLGYGAGGISLDCCVAVFIYDNEIAFNSSPNEGGGLANGESGLFFVRNYVHDNATSSTGGGLVTGKDGGRDFVVNNRFVRNSASQGGGGVAAGAQQPPLFFGNLVAGNSGGGILNSEGGLIIINTTIADNIGAGLVTSSTNGARLWNSVISGNSTNIVGTPAEVAHSLANVDPGFRGNGDYHLAPGSAAIDGGDNALIPKASDEQQILDWEPQFAEILGHDSDGDARVFDGNGDGLASIDVGSDELIGSFLKMSRVGNALMISWTELGATLQEAAAVTGPWHDVLPLATSPFTVTPNVAGYYRLRD